MLSQDTIHDIIAPLCQAALGGFMLNMMNLYDDYKKPKSRRVIKDALYWTMFFFWPAAGSILAYIYTASGYKINGMLAFTTGLTAPTVLQTMMEKASREEIPAKDIEQS